MRSRQEVLITHRELKETTAKKRPLPREKWSRRTNSKVCVFFSLFILVARRGLAGSCGRLGGGKTSRPVSCPSGGVSAAQEEEAGEDSQALIQWRIPSPLRHLTPLSLSLQFVSVELWVEGWVFRFHTLRCDHRTSAEQRSMNTRGPRSVTTGFIAW